MMIGKETAMTDNIINFDHFKSERPDHSASARAEQDLGSRSRNPLRNAMKIMDLGETRKGIKQGPRSLNDALIVRGKGQQKPGLTALRESRLTFRVDAAGLLESVNFSKGSVEDLLSIGLAGKMKKAEANLAAIEVGQLVNSAAYMNGSTIEERTVNRETGRRLAEHFAQKYFDDQDDAAALMVFINGFIERNEMLEKGYYFWEGQVYESYKPVPISIVYKMGNIHWSKETVESFKANELNVAERIKNAAATVTDDVVSAKLAQIEAKFSKIKEAENDDNTIQDLQWVLDLQSIINL